MLWIYLYHCTCFLMYFLLLHGLFTVVFIVVFVLHFVTVYDSLLLIHWPLGDGAENLVIEIVTFSCEGSLGWMP